MFAGGDPAVGASLDHATTSWLRPAAVRSSPSSQSTTPKSSPSIIERHTLRRVISILTRRNSISSARTPHLNRSFNPVTGSSRHSPIFNEPPSSRLPGARAHAEQLDARHCDRLGYGPGEPSFRFSLLIQQKRDEAMAERQARLAASEGRSED